MTQKESIQGGCYEEVYEAEGGGEQQRTSLLKESGVGATRPCYLTKTTYIKNE